MKIELHVSGIGHVPSFKNSKVIGRGRLFTKPEYQKWMEACTRSFASQLRSAFPTTAAETSTAPLARSWIASLQRFDDSRQWIVEEVVRLELVPPGAEGADVVLETVPDFPPPSSSPVTIDTITP